MNYEFTQPMQMRMDETITGTRSDVALKIFAPQNSGDLDTLERLVHQANRIVSGVAGAAETQMELISGAEELQIRIDREEIARYGVSVANIREFIESLHGGKMVSEMLVDEQRFPIALRLPPDIRNNPEQLSALQMKTPSGNLVRLDQLAEIREVRGPIVINRENADRRAVVTSNVEGRDLGSFVTDCKKAAASGLQLPSGYRLEWGGQYENQRRAQQRLAIVFPISILIIAALLYATFHNAKQMFLILCIVPLRWWAASRRFGPPASILTFPRAWASSRCSDSPCSTAWSWSLTSMNLREQGKELDEAV